MLCEEGTVVAGLLMGLNAIDYNVMMKGEDFDKSVSMWSYTDSMQQYMYLELCMITVNGVNFLIRTSSAAEPSRMGNLFCSTGSWESSSQLPAL